MNPVLLLLEQIEAMLIAWLETPVSAGNEPTLLHWSILCAVALLGGVCGYFWRQVDQDEGKEE